MTKKGFTLMELLVSMFITGMVMLSLVAMWKTSSNHTAQAQRQAIIKNDSTIFLRKIYSDFVFSSEVICPWAYGGTNLCNKDEYISLKEAVLFYDTTDNTVKITRATGPVCGSSNNEWGEDGNLNDIASRCIKPSYIVYVYDTRSDMVYRCRNNFLDGSNATMTVQNLISAAHTYCSVEDNREMVMPYVSKFSLRRPSEMEVSYEIRRVFGADIPDVYFAVKHILPMRRGA